MAEKHLLISYRDEYATQRWRHPLLSAEKAPPADQYEAISRDRFIVGSPDTAIAQLRRFQAAFGFDHLICRLYFPGLSHNFIMDELSLLSSEVMPAFQ
jgi:alkanesulfonate monooxygenase SsuD/methylene tetrahydromethanopterin reductase-like flavin-dependent oxidoreductase (luciferase family)